MIKVRLTWVVGEASCWKCQRWSIVPSDVEESVRVEAWDPNKKKLIMKVYARRVMEFYTKTKTTTKIKKLLCSSSWRVKCSITSIARSWKKLTNISLDQIESELCMFPLPPSSPFPPQLKPLKINKQMKFCFFYFSYSSSISQSSDSSMELFSLDIEHFLIC
jgi:hypothetical protein